MSNTATASELATQYQEQGYLLVPELFSREECAALKAEGIRVLAEHARPGRSVYVGVAAVSPVFYKFASDPRLVEVLREIMPDGVMFMSDKFVYKSSKHQFATPWHQDIAYWKNTRPKLSTWIALDDVTAENGAMKIIPGSHREFVEHEDQSGALGGEFGNVVKDLPEDAPNQMICAMPAGSVLFFSDLLIHASTVNTAGVDRYAIIGTYHAPAEDEPFDLNFPARHVIASA